MQLREELQAAQGKLGNVRLNGRFWIDVGACFFFGYR